MKQRIVIILATVFLIGQVFAQEIQTSDFFAQIKNYDLSTILVADTFLADETLDFEGIDIESRTVERAKILGFIGDNYQRFHIHFISVIQNPSNPYEYFAYGKTKVKENICEFQGTIKIVKSRLYEECDIPIYKQGYAECEVNLYEDSKQNSTGVFSGKLRTDFIIDNKDVFRYDAISFYADGFCNNQFVGTWTSYKTKGTKKCNWGDYRIPECEWINGCDIGAGEFSINPKYEKNGWENYRLAWKTYPETPEVIIARKKEKEEWWR